MSARHVLLGLLLHRPTYRYQLGDRLEERLGPAWKLNPGQLYRTCKVLEQAGLIERIDSAADDQTDRHVFAATPAGAKDYEKWFAATNCRPQLLRRPLLAKLALAGPERLQETLSDIDAYERECVGYLREHLEQRDSIPLGGVRVRADLVLLRLSIEATINQLDAELSWTRQVRERVLWLLGQDAIWPSARAPASALGGDVDAAAV